jgi:GTP-binding protein
MMMFIDEVTITVQSGAGGNGAISWRKEKYVPYGGPAGGDGGRGGSVFFEATDDMQTLLDFRFNARYEAPAGAKGANKNMHGKGAEDLVLFVPCGTIVKDAETQLPIADLATKGQRFLVANGGRGGRGNARFASANNKAPHYAEPGEAGITRNITLELKMLADVGLIGMPNAGKSTLISVLSSAKPKIANYPFTTLEPNLGVMRKDTGDGIVLADIPGLIEGASEGVGLGHAFLRHVERCRVLLHLVDATAQDGGTPLDNYAIIRNELTYYSPSLGQRTEVIVLTKADAMEEADFNALLDAFKQDTGKTVLGISAVAKQGLAPLKQQLIDLLEAIPPEMTKIELVEDTKATANDDSYFSIEVVDEEEGVFAVHGGKVERWLSITDISNYQSLSRFWHVLKSMGVFNALDAHGATPGDTIVIGAEMFDYIGANASASEADFDRHREGREPLEEGQVLEFDEEDDFDPSQGQVIELNLDDWQELLTHDDSDLED